MPDRPDTDPSGHGLAAYLEGRRSQILSDYQEHLRRDHRSLVTQKDALPQLLGHAIEVLDEVISAVRLGQWGNANDATRFLSSSIGQTRAAGGIHPVESLEAAAELSDIITRAMADYPHIEPRPLAMAFLALNQSMSMRIREAVRSYYGFLLHQLNQVGTEERRHLARELHDRVSADVSIAHRQLEMYQVLRDTDMAAADQRVDAAQRQVLKAMSDIRQINANLRNKPIQGLEVNLTSFLETSTPDDVLTEVIVNGNEDWLFTKNRDDLFLTIREAARNALRHSGASKIQIRIDIAPHEIHAQVEDNGAGFDPNNMPKGDGQGISSMKERIVLLGGTLRLSSMIGTGTRVELLIPQRDGGEETPSGHQ